MPAFARGGGSAGESARGVLPSRPPAAPAWTGCGEGGGRALGPAGLAKAFVRLWTTVGAVGLCRVHGRPCYPDATRPRMGLRSGPYAAAQGMGVDRGQDAEPKAGYRGRDWAQAGVRRSTGVEGGRLRDWRQRGRFR